MADSSAYTLYGVSEFQQSYDRSLLGTIFRVLRWTVGLCLLVLIVDFIFVLFIWEDGTNELARLVESERANMGLPSDRLPGAFVDRVVHGAHDWVFVKTGLTDWISNSQGGILTVINANSRSNKSGMAALPSLRLRISVRPPGPVQG